MQNGIWEVIKKSNAILLIIQVISNIIHNFWGHWQSTVDIAETRLIKIQNAILEIRKVCNWLLISCSKTWDKQGSFEIGQ